MTDTEYIKSLGDKDFFKNVAEEITSRAFSVVYVCKVDSDCVMYSMNNGKKHVEKWKFSECVPVGVKRLTDVKSATELIEHVRFFAEGVDIQYKSVSLGKDRKENEDISFYELARKFNFRFVILLFDKSKCDVKKIDTVSGFIKDIIDEQNAIKDKFNNEYNIYYRGQCAHWPAVPSLFRNKGYVENEMKLNMKIINDRPSEFADCKTTFERLVRMRHYGQPSRLLDLTSNPLIALYFACEDVKGAADDKSVGSMKVIGAVLVLYSKKEEEKYSGTSDTVNFLSALSNTDIKRENFEDELKLQFRKDSGLDCKEPNIREGMKNCVIVKPALNNERIAQQQGCFVMCGQNENNKVSEKLDRFFCDPNGKRKIFYIEPSNVEKIMEDLEIFGINSCFIYPELERDIQESKDLFKL